ncbi:MAG: Papain-like cysteine protease AvrRpt2 [Geminicoccaceae bacterium]|nr:Papain-like cysteine protease AvrRpt2 [Geminicoccaceae bacterium]
MSQVKPTDEIVVRLQVPYKAQRKKMSCWYASAKMVLGYRLGSASGIKKNVLMQSDAGRETHAHMKAKSGTVGTDEPEGVGTTEKEWPMVAKAFGLHPLDVAEVNRIASNFMDLHAALLTHGPLWCAGRFFQAGSDGGHVIVVTGLMKRKLLGSVKEYIIFHDPAPAILNGGDECVKLYDGYFKTQTRNNKQSGLFSLVETEGVPPVMYAPPA